MCPTRFRCPHLGHAMHKLLALLIRCCNSNSLTVCTRRACSIVVGRCCDMSCMLRQGGTTLSDNLRGKTLCTPFLRLHKVFLVTLPRRVSKAELSANACSSLSEGRKHTHETKVVKPSGLSRKFGSLQGLYKLRTLGLPHCVMTRLAQSLN